MERSERGGKLVELLRRYREFITYGICGVLTTAVNFAVYTPVCSFLSGIIGDYAVLSSDIISWVAAVLFAFFINKRFVFRDIVAENDGSGDKKRSERRRTAVQLAEFAGLRVVSLGVEIAFHIVFTQVLHFDDLIVKAIAAVFVVISNYIFSKFIIFRNKKEK